MREIAFLWLTFLASLVLATPPDSLTQFECEKSLNLFVEQALLTSQEAQAVQVVLADTFSRHTAITTFDFMYLTGAKVYESEKETVLKIAADGIRVGKYVSAEQRENVIRSNWEAPSYGKDMAPEYLRGGIRLDVQPAIPSLSQSRTYFRKMQTVCLNAGLIDSTEAAELDPLIGHPSGLRRFLGWNALAYRLLLNFYFPFQQKDQTATLDKLQATGLLLPEPKKALLNLLQVRPLTSADLVGHVKRSGWLPELPESLPVASFVRQWLAPAISAVPGFAPGPLEVAVNQASTSDRATTYRVTISYSIGTSIVKRTTFYTSPGITPPTSPDAFVISRLKEDFTMLNVFNQHLESTGSLYRLVWLKNDTTKQIGFLVLTDKEWKILVASDPLLAKTASDFTWNKDFYPMGKLALFTECKSKGLIPVLDAEAQETSRGLIYQTEISDYYSFLSLLPDFFVLRASPFSSEDGVETYFQRLNKASRGYFVVDSLESGLFDGFLDDKDSAEVKLYFKGKRYTKMVDLKDEFPESEWVEWVNEILAQSGSTLRMVGVVRLVKRWGTHWRMFHFNPESGATNPEYFFATPAQIAWLKQRMSGGWEIR